MISKISSWAQGIIIATIIGTIIQIILPESKNKKYIKVVIGIYILFCIINPVIGNTINLNEYNLDKYMNMTSSNTQNNSNENNDNIKKIFEQKTINTIKEKLNKEGYDSDNISVKANSNYEIKSIKIANVYEYKSKNSENINKIEINIKDKPAKGIPTSDKSSLIDYFMDTYNVRKEEIEIN